MRIRIRGIKGHYGYVLPAVALLISSVITQAAPVTESPVWLDVSALPPALQYQAGVAYINGDGVNQDIEQGRYWLHLAARQGLPLAQYNLGVMFYDGIGGEQSWHCAQWWLQRASDQSQDGEVWGMAQQALSAMADDEVILQVPYALPVGADCDHLPHSNNANVTEGRTRWETAQAFYARMRRMGAVVMQTAMTFRALATLVQEMVGTLEKTSMALSEGDLKTAQAGIEMPTLLAEEPEVHALLAESHKVVLAHTLTEVPVVSLHSGQSTARLETGEPDLAENRAPVVVSPDTVWLPVVHGEQGNEDGGPAYKPMIMPPPAPLSSPPRSTSSAPDAPKTDADKKSVTGGNLRTAPGAYYTLQLASAETPEGLYLSAKRHHLDSYLVYETRRDNRRWYVLVAGEYPTRQAALQAIRGLPVEFQKNGAWERSLRKVQSELAQTSGR